MRKLADTNFEYAFENKGTPIQYGYYLMGEEKLAKGGHLFYYLQGRIPSFGAFMEGQFGKIGLCRNV